jgi:UDPglucose 6-dehydrogenase
MEKDNSCAAVFGAGYVGLATAVGLAEQGHHDVLVERDPDRLAARAGGRIPFHEPGPPEACATQHAGVRIVPRADVPPDGLDLVFVCVGAPIDDTGYTDVSQVAHALEQAAPAVAAGAACVIRSTLPVGSAARLASRSGIPLGRIFVAPEFLSQGSALQDIHPPSRVLVGTLGEHVDADALAPARLLDEGADLRAQHPTAGDNARRILPDLVVMPTAEEALQGADSAVIATDWPVHRDLDWASVRATMRRSLIIDGSHGREAQ